MNREEITVVKIEPVPNAVISKHTVWGKNKFVAPITYVLEDGRQITADYSRDRKKDVKAYLDSLPKEPKEMKVILSNGHFVGTSQVLSFV